MFKNPARFLFALFLGYLLFSFISYLLPNLAFADDPSPKPAPSCVPIGLGGCVETEPTKLVSQILRWAIGIGGAVAFILMIFGSYKLIFSAGDPEALQEGRSVITSAIIGLLVIVLSVFILRVIGIDILGLPIGSQ